MGARLEGLQQESSALRASLAAQTLASDEKLELGQLQWALMQARQGEGESRRREAAQRARLHLTQASLYRAQLQCDQRDAQLFEAHQAQHEPTLTTTASSLPLLPRPRAYPYCLADLTLPYTPLTLPYTPLHSLTLPYIHICILHITYT